MVRAQKKYEVVGEDGIRDFETWRSENFVREQQQCFALRIRRHYQGKSCSTWCQGTVGLKTLEWEMRGVGPDLHREHVSGMENLRGRAMLASLPSPNTGQFTEGFRHTVGIDILRTVFSVDPSSCSVEMSLRD